jgi:hypothetical protein
MTEPRDRDESGRPRNSRPRDPLGRPLARDSIGLPPAVDQPALPPDEALVEASRLITGGHPFEAHEVLEAAWKTTDGADREFWRGLAQLAVGATHAARGNEAGAESLFKRAAGNLSRYVDQPPYGVDVPGLLAWCRAAALDRTLAMKPPPLIPRA